MSANTVSLHYIVYFVKKVVHTPMHTQTKARVLSQIFRCCVKYSEGISVLDLTYEIHS